MALFDLKEVENNNGKTYLAIENGKVFGLIMGIIRKFEEEDYLDYKCPQSGVITDLLLVRI